MGEIGVIIPPPEDGWSKDGWSNSKIENIEYFIGEDLVDIDLIDACYYSVSLTVSELKHILQKVNEFKIRKQIGD